MPGWPCFFNAGIEGLDAVGRFTSGAPLWTFPQSTALVIEPGTRFVVDAFLHHYNYEPLDLSVVAWTSETPNVPEPRLVHMNAQDFVIPAEAEWATTTVEAEVVEASTDLSLRPDTEPQALHEGVLWTVDVHMHHWGRAAQLEHIRADGTRACVLEIPAWDVEFQGVYRLEGGLELSSGDRLEASCEWQNRPEDQRLIGGVLTQPNERGYGLAETDEMCSFRLGLDAQQGEKP